MPGSRSSAGEADLVRSLQDRLHVCGLVLLASNATFVVIDLFIRPQEDDRIWLIRAIQVGAVVGGMLLTRMRAERRWLIGVGLATFAVVMVTMAAAWALRGDAEGLHLLAIVAALGAAALVPWGAWAQAACAVMAAAGVVLQLYWAAGAIALPSGLVGVALAVALLLSVAVARELERQRQRIHARERQRDEALAELAEGESRFRQAFDNAPIGMALVSPEGRWLKVNRRLCDIIGYSEEELLARDFQSVTHPEDLELDLGFVADTLAGRRDTYQMDKRYIHKQGRVVWVLLAVSLVRRPDGAPHYFVSQIEDVTGRVAAERDLQIARDEALAASKAKSEFLATMSHELRTPLGAMIGLAELLRDGDLDGEKREFVEIIHRSGIALLEIINDVLDLSKIEAGMVHVESAEFDIRAVLQDSCDLFAAEVRRKNLRLNVSVGADVPARARGDAGRLRQVLVNLVGNAVKFTMAGGIDVEARLAEHVGADMVIACTVRDSGIGIGEEHQRHIFDAFAQADPSTSRHYGGSGLGLAICRHLVGLMGGAIRLTSRLGQGTSVSFTLRLGAAAPAAEVEVQAVDGEDTLRSEPAPHGPSPRILVVEDHAANQEIIRRVLERLGYRVDVVGGGAAALNRLAAELYDAVLMDCAMPGMDGYQTTAELRRREADRGTRIPVIALTADVTAGARERCLSAGMDAYLAKPVRAALLDEQLRRWISRGPVAEPQ